MMQAVTLSKVCMLLVAMLVGACDAAHTVKHVLLIRYAAHMAYAVRIDR